MSSEYEGRLGEAMLRFEGAQRAYDSPHGAVLGQHAIEAATCIAGLRRVRDEAVIDLEGVFRHGGEEIPDDFMLAGVSVKAIVEAAKVLRSKQTSNNYA